MSVKMITFPGQVRTALDDAIVYRSAVSTGVLRGLTCEVDSNSNNTIRVATGFALIHGRLIESDSVVSLQIPYASTGMRTGCVYLQADVSNSVAPAQISYVTSQGEPPLIQDDDINTGGMYQMELCRFVISTSTIVGLNNTTNIVPFDAPKIYTHVSQLGLTAPAAVSTICSAMPSGSIAYIGSEEINSSTLPSNEGGILEIANLKGTGHATDMSIVFRQGKNGNDAKMFVDASGSATRNWVSIPNVEDVFYQANETDTLTCQGGGFITASNTSIRYFVSFGKLKGSISGAQVLSGTLIARQNGKYIAGDNNGSFALDDQNTLITMKSNGLMVSVSEAGGFSNATNNAPVAIYSNLTVRFL